MEKHHSEQGAGLVLRWWGVFLVPFSPFQTLFFFVLASVLLLIGITEGLGGREERVSV